MATIVKTKRNNDGVLLEVQVTYEEFLALSGHLHQVYLVAANKGAVKTNMSQRGTNGATKYFLIPRELRKNLRIQNETSCQRIDVDNKSLFVYVVDKLRTNPSRREAVIKKYAAHTTQENGNDESATSKQHSYPSES